MKRRGVLACAARRRARRGREGAVFIEALLVISALLLLFAGIVFAHTYYALRLQALRSARTAGAALALYGCDRGMNATDVLAPKDLEGIQLGGTDMLPLTNYKPETESDSAEANESLDEAASKTTPLFPKAIRLRAQGAATVREGAGGLLSGDSKSTTYVLCNDESKDGDVTLILPVIAKFSFF